MNLSNAVGAAAGVALIAILGVSVLQKPNTTVAVTGAQGDATTSTVETATTGSLTTAPLGTTAPLRSTVPIQTAPPSSAAPSTPTSAPLQPATSAAVGSAPQSTGAGTTVAPTPSSPGEGSTAGAPVPPVDKAAANVGVVNASGKAGVATAVAGRLRTLGWAPAAEPASWASSPFSVVYYAPGKIDVAKAVATSLGLPDSLVLAGQGAAPWDRFAAKDHDVLVLAGKDMR